MPRDQQQVRDLQEGGYVMIDSTPCKIVDYSTAKPGKHGSAKARINAVGVFDGKKRSLSQPVDAKIWVPIIERKQGQVVNVDDGEAQLMDLDTYQTFTIRSNDQDLNPDEEVEYLSYEGQRKFV